MVSTLITNIGEFFTGEIEHPTADVSSLYIEDGRIRPLDPAADRTTADRTIDAKGGAVLPGIIDGHVHPVFGEWTPTQDTVGWIRNYLHGGTTSMVSAGELHLPGLDWNSVEKLPWWWEPLHYAWFTIPAILIIPPLVAFAISYLNFRKRVSGVYFAIVTLAISAILMIVIIGNQGLTGGVNGINDFKTFLGMDLDNDRAKMVLYFITAVLLLLAVMVGRFILKSRAGRVLVAIRDLEDRSRFSGYDPAMFKAFIFAVAALFASIGGAMFTIQWGLASPALVGIVPSIEMVIYAAVGGRLSLIGAVYGAFLVGYAKTVFSENFVEYWIYFVGGLFVVVVMFLPKGLAGLIENLRGSGGRT